MTVFANAIAVLALGGLAAGITLSKSGPDGTPSVDESLPECDQVEFDGAHQNCVLPLGNGLVVVRVTPGGMDEWGDPVERAELDFQRADGFSQTFEDTLGSSFLHPSAEDIDGDSDFDLLLPQETGNVNTRSHVWLQGEAGFVSAGSINGIGIDPEGDGLMSVPARSSAAEWETTYYVARENRLLGVFSVSTHLAENSCSVNDWEGGLALVGLTLDEATARYCNAD
ncbi:hypothetical protein [Maricaulis maris]|uniref:hypothetical protein n=1 Tax=Maricaulis maris TaxID=74318 RepID=UPI003B8E6F88